MRSKKNRIQTVGELEAGAAGKAFVAGTAKRSVGGLLNEALKAQGHGEDPLDLSSDPLHTCGGCGRRDGALRKCTGCGGAVYCGSACQAKAWPRHKAQCCKQVALMRKALAEAATAVPRSRGGAPHESTRTRRDGRDATRGEYAERTLF